MRKIILFVAVFSAAIAGQARAATSSATYYGKPCKGDGHTCVDCGGYARTGPGNISNRYIMTAVASYSATSGLTMTYKEEDMNALAKKEFATGYFEQDSPAYLSDVLCTKLAAPRGLTIPAGRYKVSRSGNNYTVEFGKGGSIFPAPTTPAKQVEQKK